MTSQSAWKSLAWLTCLVGALAATLVADEPNVSGNAVIRAPAGRSEIAITTTSRVAGAIHSLTWDGKEFIDSADHGRQLQSASNFDVAGDFTPETFNPTEAGSMASFIAAYSRCDGRKESRSMVSSCLVSAPCAWCHCISPAPAGELAALV